MEWILEILAYQNLTATPIQIRLSSPQYLSPGRGTDFLEYFFVLREGVDRPGPKNRWIVIEEIDELGFSRSYDSDLDFDLAHRLFFNRYALQPEFAADFDSIRDRLLDRQRTVGIHFRGTDKSRAAPRAQIDSVFLAVDSLVGREPPDSRIFVATDENQFLDKCVTRYGKRVVWLDDHLRSHDGRPVHLGGNADGYRLGRDALLNCLMLSRCNAVIKTASILSAWAKVLNPSLPIFALTRGPADRSYFPERAIPDYVSEQ